MCFHIWDFFNISLNIVSSVLRQPEIIKRSNYFSYVFSFVTNLPYADFELNVNPGGANEQHLFRLSGIGQMPLQK